MRFWNYDSHLNHHRNHHLSPLRIPSKYIQKFYRYTITACTTQMLISRGIFHCSLPLTLPLNIKLPIAVVEVRYPSFRNTLQGCGRSAVATTVYSKIKFMLSMCAIRFLFSAFLLDFILVRDSALLSFSVISCMYPLSLKKGQVECHQVLRQYDTAW